MTDEDFDKGESWKDIGTWLEKMALFCVIHCRALATLPVSHSWSHSSPLMTVYQVNVKSVYLSSLALVPALQKRGQGGSFIQCVHLA